MASTQPQVIANGAALGNGAAEDDVEIIKGSIQASVVAPSCYRDGCRGWIDLSVEAGAGDCTCGDTARLLPRAGRAGT